MKYAFLALLLLPLCLSAFNLKDIEPSVQQSLMYFQSDQVTISGAGGGFSLQTDLNPSLFAKTGINLLWINGNVVETNLAVGYQRRGKWTPAISVVGMLVWGQRIQIVNPDGTLPAYPVWNAGVGIAPLRFHLGDRYVSALEVGAGIGPYKGLAASLQVLSVGF